VIADFAERHDRLAAAIELMSSRTARCSLQSRCSLQ
jgi:hypothetical protein